MKLAKEFDVKINNTDCTASVQQRTTNEQHRTAEETSKDKLIKVLENQLEEANKSRANLEKLLDQQQRLALQDKKLLEEYKEEIKELKSLTTQSTSANSSKVFDETKDIEINNKKRRWWSFGK